MQARRAKQHIAVKPDSTDSPVDPISLLLVEDNPHDAELLTWALKETPAMPCVVHWVKTIGSALEKIEAFPVDLVLLDLSLPDSAGLQSLARINSTFPDVPIIVLSALTDEKLALESVQMGADDFLMKGRVSTDGILRCIRYAIERRRFQKRLRLMEERDQRRSVEAKTAEVNFQSMLNWMARQLLVMQQREEFMATLAHDLRAPLVGTQRALGLLIEGSFGDLTETQAEWVVRIRDSNKALTQMIQNLLDVYRWESGAERLHQEDIDLSGLLRSCVDEIRIIADAKRVWLNARQLPSEPHIVYADPLGIRRVLINVLSNAVKFTPEDGDIEIRAEWAHDSVSIAVSDTGIGIAPEDQGKLFQRFAQGTNLSKHHGIGSGLGLHLCRQIVEAHQGTVTCDSEVGKGSTFTITLPVRRRS